MRISYRRYTFLTKLYPTGNIVVSSLIIIPLMLKAYMLVIYEGNY